MPGRTILLAGAITLAFAATSRATEYQFTWAHPQPQGNLLAGAAFESNTIGYAVGDHGTVIKTVNGGASWQLITDQQTFVTDLEDLVILGPGQLLAVGASPGIFRSTDGGVTWTAIANPSFARLRDIEFVTPALIATVGDDGQVLRSADGGNSWSLLASPGGDLHEQLWLDASTGYVMGTFRVRRTTNGGASWSPLPGITDSERFNEAFFTDAMHGYILSDGSVWRSTDGGATWTGQQFGGGIAYPGNTVVLGPLHFLAASNLEGAMMFETIDGGESWEVPFITTAGGFLDFDQLADGTLLAITTEGDVFRSTDDGSSWTNAIDAIADRANPLGAIAVGPSGRGAAGTTGTPGQQWYTTADGGASWELDADGPFISFTQEIAYWDANHAVVAGDVGEMWRTTDGGVTWTSVPLPGVPTNGAAWHVSLPAPGVAFAAVTGMSQSMVYRTTDFGATWEQRSTGIPASGGLTGISFPTASIGFVSGYTSGGTARMFKTTNGGASWVALATTGLPSAYAWDLHWHNALVGVATVPNSGGIYRTTNGGATWSQIWSNPVRDLDFFDSSHGVVSRDDFSPDGTVLATEDGGATWEPVTLPAPRAGTTVTATSDGFLVGGIGGIIMKATRIATSVEPVPVPQTSGVRLRARPSVGARIEAAFELPERGQATLDVIDVRGRHVARLRSGEFAQGTTVSAIWDGATDQGERAASGMYFLRLSHAGEATAIRIVLVR